MGTDGSYSSAVGFSIQCLINVDCSLHIKFSVKILNLHTDVSITIKEGAEVVIVSPLQVSTASCQPQTAEHSPLAAQHSRALLLSCPAARL